MKYVFEKKKKDALKKKSRKNLNWKEKKNCWREKCVRGEERLFEWVQNVIPLKRRESKLLEFE
jgi:hypothetical protein